jgi:hypothetical protein
MNTPTAPDQAKRIHTDPTKDFFVKMITRDIDLRDCIFDLLDNAIDGARRKPASDVDKPLLGYEINIEFDQQHFKIWDNCGGIRLSDAIDYAFHFGKRPDSPADVSGGIGLYGIGMKRAIFKIGAIAGILSETEEECFKVTVNVPEWEKKADWDFNYEDSIAAGKPGTAIDVTALNAGVDAEFADPVFFNELVGLIARDYAFFIAKGLKIQVGTVTVPSYSYQLRSNENIEPASISYIDDGVGVRIVAGLIDNLPDDIPDELTPKDVDRYGWYIVCNDRVVLPANKTDRTIWGDDGFKVWHPQYNGFAGFVFFQANDQRALPWTTTKREVDSSSPLYRRTLKRLKEVTEEFIAYTNRRKEDITQAKQAEKPQNQVNVYSPAQERPMKLPVLSAAKQTDPLVNIGYKRKESEINLVRQHLNNRSVSNSEVGRITFEYYLDVELGK